jgi:hypothetical protein
VIRAFRDAATLSAELLRGGYGHNWYDFAVEQLQGLAEAIHLPASYQVRGHLSVSADVLRFALTLAGGGGGGVGDVEEDVWGFDWAHGADVFEQAFDGAMRQSGRGVMRQRRGDGGGRGSELREHVLALRAALDEGGGGRLAIV